MTVDLLLLKFLLDHPMAFWGDCLFIGSEGSVSSSGAIVHDLADDLFRARRLGPPGDALDSPEALIRRLGCRTVKTALSIGLAESNGSLHGDWLYDPALYATFDLIIDSAATGDVSMLVPLRRLLRPKGWLLSVGAVPNEDWDASASTKGAAAALPGAGFRVETLVRLTTDPRARDVACPDACFLGIAARNLLTPVDLRKQVHQLALQRALPRVASQPIPMSHALALVEDLRDKVKTSLQTSGECYPLITRLLDHAGLPADAFLTFVDTRHRHLAWSLAAEAGAVRDQGSPSGLCHRIWLTGPSEPTMVPPAYLTTVLENASVVSSCMTTVVWSNSDEVLRHMARDADAQNSPVCTMDLRSFEGDPLLPVVERFIADRKFVLAADVAKIMVLLRHGGLYADLGVRFSLDLARLTMLVDHAFLCAGEAFFQLSVLAARAGSDFLSLWRDVLLRPSLFPRSVALAGTAVTAFDEVNVFAGPGFTAFALLFLPQSARALILPPQSVHHTWRSQQSWYGVEAKNGNRLISGSEPTILKYDDRDSADDGSNALISVRGIPNLHARLSILTRLSPYLTEIETRACRLFRYFGSDKAKSWHNYSELYGRLLPAILPDAPRILEIGIGTTNVSHGLGQDCGSVPGASLRAWREMFPGAEVIGCDIDPDLLFADDQISTVLLDQRSREAVAAFRAARADRLFDLVIDDGLHDFSANVTLFEGIRDLITEDGLHIVEDVTADDATRWREYLEQERIAGFIVALPHSSNSIDNRLVVLHRTDGRWR